MVDRRQYQTYMELSGNPMLPIALFCELCRGIPREACNMAQPNGCDPRFDGVRSHPVSNQAATGYLQLMRRICYFRTIVEYN